MTATRKTLTSACAALRRVGQSSPLLKGKDEDFAAARHFDDSVSKREVLAGREYTMDLWHARPGDIVVAKIDLKNGAVGIVPDDWKNVVVTGHFAVYEPDRTKIVPEFLRRVIQTSFFKAHLWRNKVGAEGRKEVKLDFFESQVIPLPSLAEQEAIVARWRSAQAHVAIAEKLIEKPKERLNRYLYSATNTEPFEQRSLTLDWTELNSWDVKSSRAAAFRLANPTFKPLSTCAKEATQLVKPYLEPEKEWPVYGVNNKEAVFFSHYQKGAEFRTAYKRIRKDCFFHNPTRSSVGSLGIVSEVPQDAITSPEYQVWRVRDGLLPGCVAVLVTTDYFIQLVRFHRVGAVKQRLYVENLLAIPIPKIPEKLQREIAEERQAAITAAARARKIAKQTAVEVEPLILDKRGWNAARH